MRQPGAEHHHGVGARRRADIPSRIRAEEITGRWGLAAYHKEPDRPRTEAAARNQCKQPVVISMGPTGGVMMYPPDSSKLEELRMKGAPGNKTYIGTAGEPAGTGRIAKSCHSTAA